MESELSFVCDYAQESGGKLHAIGIGWNTLYAPSLPLIHPMMSFVARVRGTIAEVGTKSVVLRLIDADGHDVIPPLEQQVPFDVRPPQLEGRINLVIMLGGLQFKKYGAYAFHLVVQGNDMGSTRFHVMEPPTTA